MEWIVQLWDLLLQLIDVVLHINDHLDTWMHMFGPWLYAILFAVVFCETGLVVTPFLPGDSLLFAAGALAARDGSPLNVGTLMLLLFVAGVVGDAVNYTIGYRIGPVVFSRENSRFLNKKHLLRAQEFYERYGGKTIVLARFMPIVRTFAPFVAGIGKMAYRRFAIFNLTGAAAWVVSFTLIGYKFGEHPAVKKNFTFVIIGIIFLSILPGVIEFLRERARLRRQAS